MLFRSTEIVVALAHDSLGLALVLTALAGIVLGMGMPTTPAYIMMVALLVPAVIKLGATTPAAHMFAFYFAILSAITPPVALAIFAAAGLAKANMWKSGIAAMRVAAPAYIVPFMFVYEPVLLLIVKDWASQWWFVVLSVTTATLGAMCLAASLHGWMIGLANAWQRVALFAAALLLIKPGAYSDVMGLALFGAVVVAQLRTRRRAMEAPRLAETGG